MSSAGSCQIHRLVPDLGKYITLINLTHKQKKARRLGRVKAQGSVIEQYNTKFKTKERGPKPPI